MCKNGGKSTAFDLQKEAADDEKTRRAAKRKNKSDWGHFFVRATCGTRKFSLFTTPILPGKFEIRPN